MRRSSICRTPSGATSRSKRSRKASRAGLVRAFRSRVRLHEISAAITLLMSLTLTPPLPPHLLLTDYPYFLGPTQISKPFHTEPHSATLRTLQLHYSSSVGTHHH